MSISALPYMMELGNGSVVMNICPSAVIRQNYNEIIVYVDYVVDCRQDYGWLIR